MFEISSPQRPIIWLTYGSVARCRRAYLTTDYLGNLEAGIVLTSASSYKMRICEESMHFISQDQGDLREFP